MKFNASLLRHLACTLIKLKLTVPYYNKVVDPRTSKPIFDLITSPWVQSFIQRSRIVRRTQRGKRMVSAAKQEQIEREVAFHLGQLARDFCSNSISENDTYNADVTQFCIIWMTIEH